MSKNKKCVKCKNLIRERDFRKQPVHLCVDCLVKEKRRIRDLKSRKTEVTKESDILASETPTLDDTSKVVIAEKPKIILTDKE